MPSTLEYFEVTLSLYNICVGVHIITYSSYNVKQVLFVTPPFTPLPFIYREMKDELFSNPDAISTELMLNFLCTVGTLAGYTKDFGITHVEFNSAESNEIILFRFLIGHINEERANQNITVSVQFFPSFVQIIPIKYLLFFFEALTKRKNEKWRHWITTLGEASRILLS